VASAKQSAAADGSEAEQVQGLPVIAFARAADFEAWLEADGASSSGLWVKLAKKGPQASGIDYATALEAALCFGWIDGQKRSYDEGFWLQRFTPRSARSRWSRINRDKADALIGAGRMRPAGRREVDLARADGRWDAAYEGQRSVAVPEDLQAALDADPRAAAFFAALDSANRYAVLYRVHEAKRAETRARRIEQLVAMLHAHETIHPRRTARKSAAQPGNPLA
jgi:uncharacterized protein YdeI (YjbR/CyaY-like superfamily)